jgi:uncharacterized protein DUF5701
MSLPTLSEQARRLIDLGVPGAAAESVKLLDGWLDRADSDDALLVVHPSVAPASALVPLLQIDGKTGFVVTDMADVDRFESIVPLPDSPLYVITGVDRGDEMTNWTPDEALPAIATAGRTPLTLNEGLCWLLQRPAALERNRCFMTIASRLRKPSGRLDARTPAIWFSNGTGRDGPENRDAPKVGWCWAGNRHTWLGFASAAARVAVTSSAPWS